MSVFKLKETDFNNDCMPQRETTSIFCRTCEHDTLWEEHWTSVSQTVQQTGIVCWRIYEPHTQVTQAENK